MVSDNKNKNDWEDREIVPEEIFAIYFKEQR